MSLGYSRYIADFPPIDDFTYYIMWICIGTKHFQEKFNACGPPFEGIQPGIIPTTSLSYRKGRSIKLNPFFSMRRDKLKASAFLPNGSIIQGKTYLYESEEDRGLELQINYDVDRWNTKSTPCLQPNQSPQKHYQETFIRNTEILAVPSPVHETAVGILFFHFQTESKDFQMNPTWHPSVFPGKPT